VNRPTVVFHADARLVNVRRLEGGLREGFIRQHAALSPQVLQRIENGLLAWPLTPGKIQTAFDAARQRGWTGGGGCAANIV
jgi:hypothetical protein